MTKELTCIGCPLGCRLVAKLDGNKVTSVEGYSCNVGKKYATEELTSPKRMVTTVMKVLGSNEPISVKTSKPIEKSKIFDCLEEIKKETLVLPVKIGDIAIKGVCKTDVDIVVTKERY